jgi:hypothetical protein
VSPHDGESDARSHDVRVMKMPHRVAHYRTSTRAR